MLALSYHPALFVVVLIALLAINNHVVDALSVSRRQALIGTAAGIMVPRVADGAETPIIDMEAINAARAKPPEAPIDMDAINAARKKKMPEDPPVDMAKINAIRSTTGGTANAVVANADPPANLSIRSGTKNGYIKIPRIGYSLYKTKPEQAERATALALRTGVRHFDVATDYGSNAEVAKSLAKYLNVGLEGLDLRDEKPDVLQVLDATNAAGNQHATIRGGNIKQSIAPPPAGSIGRKGRRDALFVHHKISNEEQSLDGVSVKRAVKKAIAELKCTYLDMVSIHSPITTGDSAARLATYAALLELRDAGFVRSVGVCNYGLKPLAEIQRAGLDLPAMNQLEISPFNPHSDIVTWCSANGVAIGVGAWSKLSSTAGLQEGWDVIGSIAKKKGLTKAQVLVRWSLQKGLVCVPRSAPSSKLERVAIAENSYGGVNNNIFNTGGGGDSSATAASMILTETELRILDGLDVGWKAGSLGRTDGWSASDVTGPDWDPTDYT